MSILKTICKDNGIKIVSITDEIAGIFKLDEMKRRGAGFAIRADGEKESYILVDLTDNTWANRNIVAHELAHILFGHLSETAISIETKEQEARIFAAVFTALMLWDEYRDNERNHQAEDVSA